MNTANTPYSVVEFTPYSEKPEKKNGANNYQQIYYGAPGTGKSHTINEMTEGESVIRTTFHPDSDYSTFVGAYKPTMGLLPICDELGQPMKIGSTMLHKEQIVYEFVEQAFLQAYVKAWKNFVFHEGKKQYLVIEEINRGNCAQIFGDLFQLLDRNDYGFSDYPINADKDMQKFLKKAFARTDEPDKQIFLQDEDKERINLMYKGDEDVAYKVFSGEILLLPNNLYIWATMNTSDQSLFPIDSAFKRRWEWQYMPIGQGYEANGRQIKWAIEGATKKYDWWSFLQKINAEVGEATQSEDKKLGFFFCKATDGEISAEKFVGKVIFYLWNDVFKNNGFEGPIFKDVDGTELSFGKFYKSDMKGKAIVQKDKVELFLNNLGVEIVTDYTEEDITEEDLIEDVQNEDNQGGYESDYQQDGRTRDSGNRLHVTFDDGKVIRIQTCDEYIDVLKKIGLEKAYEVAKTKPFILKCAFVTKTQEEPILNHPTLKYETIGEYYVVRQMGSKIMQPFLEKISNRYNLGLKFHRE
ncbi:MAG: AAA family ATPase [Bacteroidaceae bacterium]|nr:AAA family ATPase [Bacteroidaceae bacterium]